MKKRARDLRAGDVLANGSEVDDVVIEFGGDTVRVDLVRTDERYAYITTQVFKQSALVEVER